MDLKELHIGSPKRHPWEVARSRVVKSLMRPLVGNMPIHILDIGCGDIFLSKELAKEFPDAFFYCVDSAFDEMLVNNLTEELQSAGINLKLFSSFDELISKVSVQFQLILALDVMEHIQDDKLFLTMLFSSESVVDGCNVIVTVPAFNILFSAHDKFLGHFRRYSRVELQKLMSIVGTTEKRSGYFFVSLLFARIFQVMIENFRNNGRQTGVASWNHGRVLTKVLETILYLDFYFSSKLTSLFGFNIPGLSTFSINRISKDSR